MSSDFPSLSPSSLGLGQDRPLREARPVEEGMAGPKSLEAESRRPPIKAVELEATVEGLNQYLSQFSAEVRFSVDSRAEALVVKVVDASTDEVIRQIPTENTLELMHFYQELQEQSQNNHSSGRTLQERRAIEGLLIYAQV